MLACPASRLTLIAVLRRAAMTCGPAPVRTAERSSPKVTSPDPVEGVFDLPVAAQPDREQDRVGVPVPEGGDRKDLLGGGDAGGGVGAASDDLQGAGRTREQLLDPGPGQVEDGGRAELDPAVPALRAGFPAPWGGSPRQCRQRPAQGGLVAV